MSVNDDIIRVILCHPGVQAIYLFGTYDTEDERPDSDVDIGVLLAPQQARAAGRRNLAVKVVDIFGNDTIAIVGVTI